MLTASLGILLAGAAVTAFFGGASRPARLAFSAALTAGCLLGLAGAAAAGLGAAGELSLPWNLPAARLSLRADPLSAFFLLPVYGVGLLAGVFGEGYAAASPRLSANPAMRPLYLLLTASLAAVVCARNAVLFLLAWELMALTSFFLISLEHHEASVRRAGLLYLVCTHLGTLALFVLFARLGRACGSLDFERMRAAMPADPRLSAAVLALGLAGFGMKAGLAPLHVWLQEAHPAAPSHVSAVMSGVVIKMGIYGLLRLVWLMKTVPASWAAVLVGLGALSGVGGVLFALAQHDLKRLLAYHSVENIGIIALGMGLGCLGLSRGNRVLALLGFAGACLHVLNHALFKSLLFMGSGIFAQQLGTRDVERGGGLLRRMPWTSAFSLLAAAAICGLPPLNGFISEWLVFMAAIGGAASLSPALSAAAAGSLALIGGLALACFTKAYGALCLGEPRTEAARAARDPGELALWPMAALAAACAWIGLFPAAAAAAAGRAASVVCGLPLDGLALSAGGALSSARAIGLCGAAAAALAALLAASRRLEGRQAAGPTWACGFTAALPRARYSASSFAQPLTRAFAAALGEHRREEAPAGYWPRRAAFSTHTPDRVLDGALLPGAAAAAQVLAWLKSRQRSRLQYYLLYVSLFLILLLYWKL